MSNDTRAVAARVVDAVGNRGQSLDRALASADVVNRDQALLRELCYGTLRGYHRYRALVNALLQRPLKRRDGDIEALLLIGCHQLLGMRVADHAAVSTAVSAVVELGKPWAKGVVNAVLRQLQRRQQELVAGLEPAAAAAMPSWLYDMLLADWPDDITAISEASNAHPPMFLRVNRRHIDRERYLDLLTPVTGAAAHAYAPDGLLLDTPVSVEQLPGFVDGWVSVQDASAQLCADLLELAPGLRVLDACAAPGGKACHILERCPELSLTCLDSDESRLDLVRENLLRLKLDADVITGDAGAPEHWWDSQPFDRILIDAPCSATGVMRRHPDIRVLRRASDINSLCRTQARILAALWPLLAPGGLLVYATCSILKQENQEQVSAFLAAQPDARERPIKAAWGRASSPGQQLLPGLDEGDGFYFAKLDKLLQSAD